MKNFLIALFTVGTLSAHASMLEINGPLDSQLFESEIFQDKSYFETLGDMFNAGIKPDPKKLTGLWAGRCFFRDNPNDPTNGAYIFRIKNKSDVGPIGQDVETYEATAFYTPSESPSYYDNMTIQDAEKELAESSLVTFQKVTSTPMSLVITYSEGSVNELRLSGKYLIVEGRNVDVFGRCYYFIPGYINH